MSKIGVGVGEDFPVAEEVNEGTENAEQNRHCGHRGRDRWRHFRHKMRGARHGFHHRHGDAEELMAHIRAHHLKGLLIGGLALVGVAAILSALQSRR